MIGANLRFAPEPQPTAALLSGLALPWKPANQVDPSSGRRNNEAQFKENIYRPDRPPRTQPRRVVGWVRIGPDRW